GDAVPASVEAGREGYGGVQQEVGADRAAADRLGRRLDDHTELAAGLEAGARDIRRRAADLVADAEVEVDAGGLHRGENRARELDLIGTPVVLRAELDG